MAACLEAEERPPAGPVEGTFGPAARSEAGWLGRPSQQEMAPFGSGLAAAPAIAGQFGREVASPAHRPDERRIGLPALIETGVPPPEVDSPAPDAGPPMGGTTSESRSARHFDRSVEPRHASRIPSPASGRSAGRVRCRRRVAAGSGPSRARTSRYRPAPIERASGAQRRSGGEGAQRRSGSARSAPRMPDAPGRPAREVLVARDLGFGIGFGPSSSTLPVRSRFAFAGR